MNLAYEPHRYFNQTELPINLRELHQHSAVAAARKALSGAELDQRLWFSIFLRFFGSIARFLATG